MVAAALVEPLPLARRLGLRGAHRSASLPPARPLAPGLSALGPPPAALGARRARPTRSRRLQLCARALPPAPRAHSRSPRRHQPPDTLMLSAVGNVGALPLASETCPRTVAPGGQRLPQPSPFAPAVCLSQPASAGRRGDGGSGRRRVHWAPPYPRLHSRCAPEGTRFAQRLSGNNPQPLSLAALQFSPGPEDPLAPLGPLSDR